MNYNATALLRERYDRLNEEGIDEIIDALIDYHPAVNCGVDGRAEVVITLPAETLGQAERTALAVLGELSPVGLEVLPTEVWDARADAVEIPELVSVAEAAEMLGVSRQAVSQRIKSGSLPARRVGGSWVLARAALA